MQLRVVTYNIHKGFSPLNRRVTVHEVRDQLRTLNADLVFLQEVQGEHAEHAQRHADWPTQSQHEFLAGNHWQCRYGCNAVYPHGHHGNAILSRFNITATQSRDISQHRLEQRGILHCEMHLHADAPTVHALCVHFGLTHRWRRQQLSQLIDHVAAHVPPEAPLIIAGDFNDWRNQLNHQLEQSLGMHEVFTRATGTSARSFPSILPIISLDRIFIRGFEIEQTSVHHGGAWSRLSDHAALCTDLRLSRQP